MTVTPLHPTVDGTSGDTEQFDRIPPADASPPQDTLLTDAPPPDAPRNISTRTLDDTLSFVGSLAGSGAFIWVLYENILPLSGILGFVVCWWAAFLVTYLVVSAVRNPQPIVVDRLVSAVAHSVAVLVGFALLTVIWYTLSNGYHAMLHSNFYTHDMAGIRPTAELTHGGVRHALIGTLVQVALASAISLPLGVGTAVYLTEVGGRLARVVRTVVEAMTALPDVLAGLFVYTVLIITFHVDKTGIVAAIALSVTMVPIVARTSEVALRVVPGGLREASLALGASQWQTVWRVVLPTSRAGLATALILGVARVAGETAPLLIVSGASSFTNADPVTNPMNSLPLFIYSAVRSGEVLQIKRGFGAAALLLLVVLVLFVLTRFLARDRGRR